jgi:hypothetical protein
MLMNINMPCSATEATVTTDRPTIPPARPQWPLGRRMGSWIRIPLKAWMSVCVYFVFMLFCVYVAALRRPDSPSKKSYRLCIGLRHRKRSQGPTKDCRATDRQTGRIPPVLTQKSILSFLAIIIPLWFLWLREIMEKYNIFWSETNSISLWNGPAPFTQGISTFFLILNTKQGRSTLINYSTYKA